jgi:hypothetical protein
LRACWRVAHFETTFLRNRGLELLYFKLHTIGLQPFLCKIIYFKKRKNVAPIFEVNVKFIYLGFEGCGIKFEIRNIYLHIIPRAGAFIYFKFDRDYIMSPKYIGKHLIFGKMPSRAKALDLGLARKI